MPAGCPRFCIFQGGVSAISKVVHELNEEICDKEIRLIGAAGEQLGITADWSEWLYSLQRGD